MCPGPSVPQYPPLLLQRAVVLPLQQAFAPTVPPAWGTPPSLAAKLWLRLQLPALTCSPPRPTVDWGLLSDPTSPESPRHHSDRWGF